MEVFEAYLTQADVRPHGVLPHQEFVDQYRAFSPLFGRNPDWRCPYYLEAQGGLCGIWEDRNARCATWFCKHLRGQLSRSFWDATEKMLTAAEKCLSHWCIHKLEAGSVEFRNIFPISMVQPSLETWLQQQSFYQKYQFHQEGNSAAFQEWTWGKWLNRQADFFSECSRLVTPLVWKDVKDICGAEIETLEQNVLDSHAKLVSVEFPVVLKLSDIHYEDYDSDQVHVWTSNPYDSILMQKSTLRLLHRMSGRKMVDVIPWISKPLLQQLFDAGVLIGGKHGVAE